LQENSLTTTLINAIDLANASGDFARVRRIVKTDEFSSVFRLRPVQRTSHFVLYARPTELPHARLGVVAAKRFAPRAVTRNTIKRVTREIFRQSELINVDFIVRLSKPVNSKAGPATTASLKRALRVEIVRLFSGSRSDSTADLPTALPSPDNPAS
jgi:ribonuclease P protein component